MNKIKLYKFITEYIDSSEDAHKVNQCRELMNEVVSNSISVNDAVEKFRSILTANSMIPNIVNKTLGRKINEYLNRTLSDPTELAKMTSSVITHHIIESANNDNYSYTNSDALPALDVLNEYFKSGKIDTNSLDSALQSLGLYQEVTK